MKEGKEGSDMGGIRSAIELQDNFSGILLNVIDVVNRSVSAIGQMQSTMDEPVDTAFFQEVQGQIAQATVAAQELHAALQGVGDSVVAASPALAKQPATWQGSSMEVFTNSGMERFQQEVQSMNGMLEQLSSTQDAIARQAYDTNIFPPNAFRDLNELAVRIDMMGNRIQQIENNPINFGTDTAIAEVEQMRGWMAQAVREQENLNRAIQAMDVQAANEAYLRLSQTVGNTERHIRDNVDEQGRFNREIEEGTDEASELMQTIKGAVAAYATIQSLSAALSLSDQLTSTAARLDLMNDGLQSTQDLQNMIYLSAERARGSYQATADAVSKLGLMAGDAFSSSEEIIAFMEQVNKQFAIAGTEASGIDAAMLQLTQAMGSGVLRGEEYNSILEQAPNIIQAIADYLEVPKGELKDMAAEGQITAEIVKAAMFAAADETNAQFESMPKTFEQIWTSFENTALMAFRPVLEQMNEIANSESFQDFVTNATEALSVVAGIALEIFGSLVSVAGAISDNWSWISPIIYGVAGALAVYYGWQLLCAAAQGAMAVKQAILNAVMAANPIMLVVLAIIMLVALFYAAVAAVNHFTDSSISATGLICGAFATLGAFLLNTIIGIINAILQVIWAAADPFIGIIEWVLNVANGGFDSFGGAVASLVGNIISWFLSLGKVVAKIVDSIFGTDWTSGLNHLQEAVLAWGKNDDAITLDRNAPMIDYRISYSDAWDAGYSFGERIEESVASFDISSLFDINMPDANDYSDLSNYGADIAWNTGKIADGMDITGEELKYLRDIAEQEAVNRFTTAEITIKQTNHNTIKNGMDLDGVMSSMADMVNEAIEISAEGVHD